ncbi:MAG: roadblock/LC7 domain-containing protein [Candidatus Odinarchaeia archaeon]
MAALGPAVYSALCQALKEIELGELKFARIKCAGGTVFLESFKVNDGEFILVVLTRNEGDIEEKISKIVEGVKKILSKII